MRIKNPVVTLEDEARTIVKEEVRSGFLDWLFTSVVTGDDGELYEVGGSILSLAKEQINLVTFNLAKGKGCSCQLPNSIYRIGKYPGQLYKKKNREPGRYTPNVTVKSLTVTKSNRAPRRRLPVLQ